MGTSISLEINTNRDIIYMNTLVDGDFLVSFVADARGAVLYSKRLPGFKILVPAASLQQPTRIFARAINEKCTLRLMDGEMQASKILQFLPIKFNADIELDIPCLVPESRDHDVLVLMSQDRLSWKQIRANFDNEMSSCTSSRRVTLDYLPAYIGLYAPGTGRAKHLKDVNRRFHNG